MHGVNMALLRIEMDARAFVASFEAALEKIVLREDRSNVVVRPMRESERNYRGPGVIHVKAKKKRRTSK